MDNVVVTHPVQSEEGKKGCYACVVNTTCETSFYIIVTIVSGVGVLNYYKGVSKHPWRACALRVAE